MMWVIGLIVYAIVVIINFVAISSRPDLDFGLILLAMLLIYCGATYYYLVPESFMTDGECLWRRYVMTFARTRLFIFCLKRE